MEDGVPMYVKEIWPFAHPIVITYVPHGWRTATSRSVIAPRLPVSDFLGTAMQDWIEPILSGLLFFFYAFRGLGDEELENWRIT